MPDSAASDASHDSGDENSAANASKGAAVKDKECQYCHQLFTSSSLGRHLDQFLSKKKPDGIHDVDEIRRTRGGITRRTARGKREHDESQSSQASPAPQSLPRVIDTLNRLPPGGMIVGLNRMNWQSTGVITDASTLNSPSAGLIASPPVISSPSGKKRSFSTFIQDMNPTTAVDTARALELSLREVLDCLRAANKRASPEPSPFSFDIQSQTFPSLCLAVLPMPPTLFQTSPFSTLHSISISPPGRDQIQPLRSRLTTVIDQWKWNTLRLAQSTTSNIGDEADFLARSAASYLETAMMHVETSYQNWMAHPPEIRNALWAVELLRAYKQEQDKVKNLEEQVERIQQEATQLQQQVEYLSKCQWPREMALWPPERKTFDHTMREELRLTKFAATPGSASAYSVVGGSHDNTNGNGDHDHYEGTGNGGTAMSSENIHTRGDKWDFDKLVNKWKAHIREDRNRRNPLTNEHHAAPASTPGGAAFKGPTTTMTATAGGASSSSIPPDLKKSKTEPGGSNNHSNTHTPNGVSAAMATTPGVAGGETNEERYKNTRLGARNVHVISDL